MANQCTIEKGLQDLGCTFPECNCNVPDFALSEYNRKNYCKVYIKELLEEKEEYRKMVVDNFR